MVSLRILNIVILHFVLRNVLVLSVCMFSSQDMEKEIRKEVDTAIAKAKVTIAFLLFWPTLNSLCLSLAYTSFNIFRKVLCPILLSSSRMYMSRVSVWRLVDAYYLFSLFRSEFTIFSLV
jgi:hypothetical protein